MKRWFPKVVSGRLFANGGVILELYVSIEQRHFRKGPERLSYTGPADVFERSVQNGFSEKNENEDGAMKSKDSDAEMAMSTTGVMAGQTQSLKRPHKWNPNAQQEFEKWLHLVSLFRKLASKAM